MKLDMSGLKAYLVIKDYSSGKMIGINKSDGSFFLTDYLHLAKTFSNRTEARQIRDKYPMENWILVFAKIKLSKKQSWT